MQPWIRPPHSGLSQTEPLRACATTTTAGTVGYLPRHIQTNQNYSFRSLGLGHYDLLMIMIEFSCLQAHMLISIIESLLGLKLSRARILFSKTKIRSPSCVFIIKTHEGERIFVFEKKIRARESFNPSKLSTRLLASYFL